MSGFLQEIIVDENLVWDKSLGNKPEKFFVKLTSKTIDEIKRNRKELENINESSFPELKNEINELKTKKILLGVGLLIIDGKSFLDFSKDEIKKIYEIICNMLGTLYIQNIKSEKIIEIISISHIAIYVVFVFYFWLLPCYFFEDFSFDEHEACC